jgi:hypothetical protein
MKAKNSTIAIFIFGLALGLGWFLRDLKEFAEGMRNDVIIVDSSKKVLMAIPKETLDTFKIQNSILNKLIINTPADIINSEEGEICNTNFGYLGIAKTKLGIEYRIATLSEDIGNACRNSTRILIYDNNFKYLGNYYTPNILPTSLDQNTLLGQDLNSVDLSNGIPDSSQFIAGSWSLFEK